jgi:hypothetical protein
MIDAVGFKFGETFPEVGVVARIGRLSGEEWAGMEGGLVLTEVSPRAIRSDQVRRYRACLLPQRRDRRGGACQNFVRRQADQFWSQGRDPDLRARTVS